MDYIQQIMTLTENNNLYCGMIYRMLEVEAGKQSLSPEEYHSMVKQYDALCKHTHTKTIYWFLRKLLK
jgi:hypothetical protein